MGRVHFRALEAIRDFGGQFLGSVNATIQCPSLAGRCSTRCPATPLPRTKSEACHHKVESSVPFAVQ